MKTYDYNIVMIDTSDSIKVLEIFISYGKLGWRFVSWFTPPKQISDKIPTLTYGIFEKEISGKDGKIDL